MRDRHNGLVCAQLYTFFGRTMTEKSPFVVSGRAFSCEVKISRPKKHLFYVLCVDSSVCTFSRCGRDGGWDFKFSIIRSSFRGKFPPERKISYSAEIGLGKMETSGNRTRHVRAAKQKHTHLVIRKLKGALRRDWFSLSRGVGVGWGVLRVRGGLRKELDTFTGEE